MAKFCGSCGTPLGEDTAFCIECGKAVSAPQRTTPSVLSPQISVPPPPPNTVFSGVPPPPDSAPYSLPPSPGPKNVFATPPPPPIGNESGSGPSYSTEAAGGLPPSPPLWDFQKKLIPTGESLAKGLGPNATGVMKLLSRIIRATFLDPRVSRQAALDENGTREAILAIMITTVPGIVLGWLGTSSVGVGIMNALISTVIMSLVSLGIMVWLLSTLSLSLLGVKLTSGQLLRVLAYAQGANMLSFVPGIGRVIALWSIVSGVAAVREISGCETQKVAIFMIVGAVAAMLAAMLIGPILYSALSVF